jgi:phosphoribosylamine-glycine ligase
LVLFNLLISGNEKDLNEANTALRLAGIEAQEEFTEFEGARALHILLYAETAEQAEARIRDDLLPPGDYRVEAQPPTESAQDDS